MKITNDREANGFSWKCDLGQFFLVCSEHTLRNTVWDGKCSIKLEHESMIAHMLKAGRLTFHRFILESKRVYWKIYFNKTWRALSNK